MHWISIWQRNKTDLSGYILRLKRGKEMEKQKKNLGSVAFLPLIVFLVCYVGCGITFTLMGADDPFGKFPRHVALLAGCAVALLFKQKYRCKR